MKTPSVYVPGPARLPRILAYHEVSRRFQLGVTGTTPDRLRSHLDYLSHSGLKFISLRGLANGSPEDSVCLTFDDGYESFYDETLPLLTESVLPATLFIITGYVGKFNRWEVTFGVNRRRHVGWERLRQIRAAGIDIGSHTRSHRDLTRMSLDEVQAELADSKKALEDHLGEAVTTLALPFGSASREIFRLARKAGYEEICGSLPGIRGALPGVLPRIPVYRWDGRKALKRKLNLNPLELTLLGLVHNCSRGTRWVNRNRRP